MFIESIFCTYLPVDIMSNPRQQNQYIQRSNIIFLPSIPSTGSKEFVSREAKYDGCRCGISAFKTRLDRQNPTMKFSRDAYTSHNLTSKCLFATISVCCSHAIDSYVPQIIVNGKVRCRRGLGGREHSHLDLSLVRNPK